MLIYRLEIRKAALFVQLRIQGSKRILYLDTLKSEATPKEAAAVQFLIKAHLRANGGHSVDTLSFQEIALPSSIAIEALRLLLPTGNLYFQDVPLQSASTAARLIWKGESISEHAATLQAFLDDIPLERVDVLFPGFAIVLNRWIEIKTHMSWKWVELFQKGVVTLEGAEKKRFIEEKPDVLWKKKESAPVLEMIPRLVLTDRGGSFANLWIDYTGLGSIAIEDLSPHIGGRARLKKAELEWEKDLLEAGFQKKTVGTSRYYCPSEKTVEALQLLLGVGWRCTNAQNKTVLLQTGLQVDVSDAEDAIELQGSVQFQGKMGPLTGSMLAAKNGQSFVDIDSASVGLIDRGAWTPLLGAEIVGPVLSFAKSRVGELLPLLGKQGFHLPDSLRTVFRQLDAKEGFDKTALGEQFQGTLLPYQEKGVAWLSFLQRNGFGALLSDEMGLGKTVQTLAFFSQLRTNLPILVVAPTSLMFNWGREIAKFWPTAEVYLHLGPDRLKTAPSIQAKGVVLTSYGTLRVDQEIFADVPFEVIALDESQAIKTHKSLTAQAAYQLQGKFRIAITGTPIENRPEELWSQFRFLMPELLGDQAAFLSMPHAVKGLRIKPFILRRSKKEVQIQLPEKKDLPLWVEMNEKQQALYDDTLSALKGGLLRTVAKEGVQPHRFELLAAILRLRQICCDPRLVGEDFAGAKAEQFLQMAEEWRESGAKALVFSQFTTLLRLLQKDLQAIGIEPLYLDGSVPAAERGELVRRFQEENNPHLFLLSLKAGGVGLNLTAAERALLLEPWWNEAVEQQAIDRAHRIGQKNTLWVHRFLTPNAIEEKMLHVKGRKLAFADEILNGSSEGEAWSMDDLAELML